MKFGICGYGNLGKKVEENILKQGDELVGIFSRRKGVKSEKGTEIFEYDEAKNFEGKIDVMIMCGGSQEDLLWQSPDMLKYFNIIDTFDTHNLIQEHKLRLEKVSALSGYSAIYSCGWDPGLFSLMRVIMKSVLGKDSQTFWGKGVSQGHSEALRNIKGISDAIQFTIPNTEIIEKVRQNGDFLPKNEEKHIRECHIALDGTRELQDLVEEINNTENYFKGQKVIVIENTLDEIAKLKKKMYHSGIVLNGDEESSMEFDVRMDSNPNFTANVVLAYAHSLPKLKRGVYSVLDIPLVKLIDDSSSLI